MRLSWIRDSGELTADGRRFVVTNRVRNEIDPLAIRRLHDPGEVRRAVVDGQWGPPYMPRRFPLGTWRILAVEDTSAQEFTPIKIRTDAHQPVHVWALDADGGYDHETPEIIEDSGYHLHWARDSRSTLGCGRVGTDTAEQVRELARIIRTAMARGERVELEVV